MTQASLSDYNLYDDGWGKFWSKPDNFKDPRQTEFQFFWPLTEQIPLDLDYTGCSIEKTLSVTTGTTFVVSPTTNINPTLSVKATNSVGELNIGGINIGMEKKPNILQRVLHKLLGFNWKDY